MCCTGRRGPITVIYSRVSDQTCLEPDIEVDVTDVLKNSSSQAIKGVQVHAQKQKQRIAASKVNAESCPKARGLVPK